MSAPIGLVLRDPGWRRGIPLGLYVLLKGLDATVLKALQTYGAAHTVNGENPISFCNVFFVAQLVIGLASLIPGRASIQPGIALLNRADRKLLFIDAGLGLFIGPIAYYFALESLSVISQTLLFALVLPVSALLARQFLAETLPRGFWLSLSLIATGLLLPGAAMAAAGGHGDQLSGYCWALVGVLAFGSTAVTGRSIATRHWPAVVTVGIPSTISALLFGIIALVLFGPGHFHLLNLRWVVGVILIYGLTLSLGSTVALGLAYRQNNVATVSIWGSLTIVVAIASASLFLGEPLGMATVAGVAFLLAGIMVSHRSNQSDRILRRYVS
ncbi:DMT family transporter [Synechococcus sp. J7-Johnson]|uniref:DMT family transporter n=1 Tax=Synechococcus sp. J7-Johnson TaxID=2823737 RepID=UPI0020CF1670|nr:DMT family transporter [Synechococcus sp. J7-Johnson]MCP9839627.1 DMT family transporter [Synechococcus sp. J7-Johnson]